MTKEVCVFCKIINGILPAKKIYEDDDLLIIEDIEPQAPDHFLIIPKKHIEGVDSLQNADKELIGKMFMVSKILAKDRKVQDGAFRLVVNNGELAGQSVFHLHMHFLANRAMHWPPG
jgi:histidine triad (HIT) family protein